MKLASFEYFVPDTLAEAVTLLEGFDREGSDAKIIAGGQSLMPMLAMRVAKPKALIDLGRIQSLDYVREDADAIAIGSMASNCSVEDSKLIRIRQLFFHAGTKLVGHRPIRNRGSVGGRSIPR